MAKAFSGVLFVLGAIQLVWGYFSDRPIIPAVSNWFHSKGICPTMTNIIIGAVFVIGGFLVLWFSKSKPAMKPLKISPVPFDKPLTGLNGVFSVSVENQNKQSATGVEIRLLKIEPPLKHRAGGFSTDKLHLPSLRFSPKDFQNDTLKPAQCGHFDILKINRSAAETEIVLKFATPMPKEENWQKITNEFVPEIESHNGKYGMLPIFKAHIFTFEATANGLETAVVQCKVLFSIDREKHHFEIIESETA